jgi:predicted SAM-dependent methyltransferase
MRYDLGAGQNKEPGFVSVDISDKCGADIVADVTEFPWDWMAGPVEAIRADNLAEHLSVEERIAFFNECHDRLEPGGMLWIRVPLLKLDNDHISGAFSDPTHKTVFTTETADYFNQDHQRGKVFGRDYGIKLWKVQRNEEWGTKFLIMEFIKP